MARVRRRTGKRVEGRVGWPALPTAMQQSNRDAGAGSSCHGMSDPDSGMSVPDSGMSVPDSGMSVPDSDMSVPAHGVMDKPGQGG